MEIITFYYHFDGLGSVVALSNNVGEIEISYTYDAFGYPYVLLSSFPQEYRFTGRKYDYETGNYYYRARYYNPRIGRFLQPDPVGYSAGLNLYTYCINNPLNWVDPWGEASIGATPAGWPINQIGKAAYGNTIYAQHWQIFYNDGSNSGYFGNSWAIWGSPVFGPTSATESDYNIFLKNLDDNLLKQAESNVQSQWRSEGKSYDLVNHSCQTYVIDVLREYQKLKKEKKLEEERKKKQ